MSRDMLHLLCCDFRHHGRPVADAHGCKYHDYANGRRGITCTISHSSAIHNSENVRVCSKNGHATAE